MQPSLFLITSTHRGWRSLRPRLHDHPYLHVVGETADPAQAARAIATLRPAAILLETCVTEPPLVSLLHDIHAASPSSTCLLLSDEALLAHLSLRALGHLATTHLTWSDVDADTVSDCLLLNLRHNLVVGSRAVLYAYLAAMERRQGPRDPELVLTTQERAVLRGLTAGLTQRKIATAAHISEPTVRRIIAALRKKFGVATTNALCAQAGRLEMIVNAS